MRVLPQHARAGAPRLRDEQVQARVVEAAVDLLQQVRGVCAVRQEQVPDPKTALRGEGRAQVGLAKFLAQSWRGISVCTPAPSPSPLTKPVRWPICARAARERFNVPKVLSPPLRTLR